MKKTIYFIFSFILLILINECTGYKPIFGSSNLQFKIADYTIEGNKVLGKKIYAKLYSISQSSENDQNARSVDFFINVSKDKNASVKNSAGIILEYKITLNSEIKVKDFITDDQILNQTFTFSLTYDVQNQQSDTVKLENRSIEAMIDKTYQELLIKLSQNI